MSGVRSTLVSIITVVFNGVSTIEETIRSVAAVKDEGVEYIIVDGGSTDGTLDAIKKHAGVVDILVSERDAGIYDAMNKGLRLARGNWCIFIGSDDILLPGFKNALSLLRNRNVLYYGRVVSNENLIGCDTNNWGILRRNIPHQAVFYPLSYYKNNTYNLKYKICSDHEYNIRLFFSGLTRNFIGIEIADFGTNGVSSVQIDYDFMSDYLNIVLRHAGWIYYIPILLGRKMKMVCKWPFFHR